ncbi:MAG: anhydro-N-acetylmuramic acid kinase [Cyanobacteria bacterium SZAS LIN-2]|nr:anhydro-N-acetylmuramic acid kinase [Cyanobacteria bacterium SZAS LIN-2]
MRPLTTLNVIGLNSGTSMDGIDAALFAIGPARTDAGCQANGVPKLTFELISSELVPFDPAFKRQMERLVASGEASLKQVCLLNSSLGEIFAQACQRLIRSAQKKGVEVDLIGSHGQTIWHAPTPGPFFGTTTAGTLQLGDPAYIAALTGVTTVGDFRTTDLALGGQGAPLVSFADQVLFGSFGKAVGVLNLGGIANITVIDEHGEAIMAFDTGPANVLLDEATRLLFDKEYDAAGAIAARGKVQDKLLKQLLGHPYLSLKPPKTTGRELFGRTFAAQCVNDWQAQDVSPEDIVATLTAFTAASVANAYSDFIRDKQKLTRLVLGGGGEANKTLVAMLAERWPEKVEILSHEDFGVSAKFKEALLFALLAYTTYFEIPNNVPACTGAKRKACLGKVVKA